MSHGWTDDDFDNAIGELTGTDECGRLREILDDLRRRSATATGQALLQAIEADTRRRLHQATGQARAWFRNLMECIGFSWDEPAPRSQPAVPANDRDDPLLLALLVVEEMISQNFLANAAFREWSANPARRLRPANPSISNTTGWDDERILARLREVEELIEVRNAGKSALNWWQEFLEENKSRKPLILRFAEEIFSRNASLNEFYQSYQKTKTDNIIANLDYMDYVRFQEGFSIAENAASHGGASADPWINLMNLPPHDDAIDTSDLSPEALNREYETLKAAIGWFLDDEEIARDVSIITGNVVDAATEPKRLRTQWTEMEATAGGQTERLIRLAEELAIRLWKWHEFLTLSTRAETPDLLAKVHYATYFRVLTEEPNKEKLKRRERRDQSLKSEYW